MTTTYKYNLAESSVQRAIKELYVTRDDKHSIETKTPLATLSVYKVFWV